MSALGAAIPVIEVDGLRTAFGEHVVHDDIDLTVFRGEVLGVIGGSGSGKSVLLRTIVGLRRPDAGTVRLLGVDMAKADDDERRAIERRFGLLFQDGALFSSLTVLENVKVPLVEYSRDKWRREAPRRVSNNPQEGAPQGRLTRNQRLPGAFVDDLARLKLALTQLGADAAEKYPAELSGGMRRRAGLARAIALDPEILFLDEPTAGLDPIAAAAIDDLVSATKSAMDLTVFLVTHDLDSVYTLCDRVAVLADRTIVAIGPPAEVARSEHPWVQACFSGPRGRGARSHWTSE